MTPRRAARVDNNQTEIVEALRRMGATVQDLSPVGKGCPDILVGFQGRNVLMEIKRPDGPKGGRAGRHLTTDQKLWHLRWRGQVCIVRTVDEAIQAACSRRG